MASQQRKEPPLNCQYSPLEREALLHIAGPDSLTFLQGQTTCDTRNAGPDRALPGVYLSLIHI